MSRRGPLTAAPDSTEPDRNCTLCPRLAAFRDAQRASEPAWFNAPVPTFGDLDARLLVVGLAPGLRGANRTGRPFTGDFAGDLLYATLASFGFTRGVYRADPDDGLILVEAAVTNAVRCVPPQNKPTGAEIRTCRGFLAATIEGLAKVEVILCLGRIAHDSVVRSLGGRLSAHPFAHGAVHRLDLAGRPLRIADSYHCSRYNTNTGVLTTEMFRSVVGAIRADLDGRAG